jgi:2-polyprenyl-6-methoxyphenol hydroxylase-like FAD-dependent oxidoreductase
MIPVASERNLPINTRPKGPEVVVVGGGPTGLWLACELALARVHVVVLERLAEPSGLSKALGLQSRTMEMFEHRAILDRFVDGNPAAPFLNCVSFGFAQDRFPSSSRGHHSPSSSRVVT